VRNAAASLALLVILLAPLAYIHGQQGKPVVPNLVGFPDPGGVIRTFNQNGSMDTTGPFSQSLGTNGRSCSTCVRRTPQRQRASLLDIVNFYDTRFNIGFTAEEKSDLVAFLGSL
jgi:hypothetical protein